MLKVRIIPCLDVKDGRVVKGINFINLKDAGDPVEQAKIYDGQGADELCFLDITASSDKRNTLLKDTDWWGASDNTMTAAQTKYRQDLRDLPTGLDTVDKVGNVTWPTKP